MTKVTEGIVPGRKTVVVSSTNAASLMNFLKRLYRHILLSAVVSLALDKYRRSCPSYSGPICP